MNPKYSILLCNQSLERYGGQIRTWLHQGIKVIWLGKHEEAAELRREHAAFADALLLIAHEITIKKKLLIIDGNDPDGYVESILQRECPRFN